LAVIRRSPEAPAIAAEAPVAPDPHIAELGQRLLEGGLAQLSARDQRVIATIADRHHVTRSVNSAVAAGETFGDRIADRVARFGGSWTFIILFIAALILWVGGNTLAMAHVVDPYPFIFLNLLLSMVAALQAPIILMSQNRQAARDRIAAGLDYEVNLKAELEIMALHEKLDGLRIDQLEAQLARQGDLLRTLASRLPGTSASAAG